MAGIVIAVSNYMTIGRRVPIGLIFLYLVTHKKSRNDLVTTKKGKRNRKKIKNQKRPFLISNYYYLIA